MFKLFLKKLVGIGSFFRSSVVHRRPSCTVRLAKRGGPYPSLKCGNDRLKEKEKRKEQLFECKICRYLQKRTVFNGRIELMDHMSLVHEGEDVAKLKKRYERLKRKGLLNQATPETLDKVCQIIRENFDLPFVSAEHHLFHDFYLDYQDLIGLVETVEDQFHISVDKEIASNIATVQEAANMIQKALREGV